MVDGQNDVPGQVSDEDAIMFSLDELQSMQHQMQRFMLEYEFGLREIETKIAILRDEFQQMHEYNPIEHVSSRIKSSESIVSKVGRKGLAGRGSIPDLAVIREHLTDIAGVRVTCSFVSDTYRLFTLLTEQEDITVRTVKDYIREPKPNGYMSLHAIVDIPVFLSTGRIEIPVEIQFRTIAMDFWASLEHKIYYKYDGDVPAELLAELKDAADTASALDAKMEDLHRELHGPAAAETRPSAGVTGQPQDR